MDHRTLIETILLLDFITCDSYRKFIEPSRTRKKMIFVGHLDCDLL